MKTLIVAVNSKFIHSSLAAYYLKYVCIEDVGEVKVLEYTINDHKDQVLASIYGEKAEVVAFSCYIWNYEYIKDIVTDLKALLPHTKIILGGPEVSYNPEEVMYENSGVDYIIIGEGEVVFPHLLKNIFGCKENRKQEISIDLIKGLAYRKDGKVYCDNHYNMVSELTAIPSPYTEDMLQNLGPNRILYYESSRGCPFSCSYCISSTFEGVRYFSMDKVKRDILWFINKKIRLVKFVDRTFNCNRERANEILEFIVENAGDTNFHFEVAGDLFDEKMFRILEKSPKGIIQFEIGIQTVNLESLEAICRKTNLDQLFNNVRRLLASGNIHIHVDLIAGLPKEDFESFEDSFNKVYDLKPHQLQLGFLKLLKGSRIRREAEEFQYVYKRKAPYEILGSMFLSYDEIVRLKEIEELVERYYNSGRFQKSLGYLIEGTGKTPFRFFDDLSRYWKSNGFFDRSISGRELYTILISYLRHMAYFDVARANELLKLDFLSAENTNNLPKEITRSSDPISNEEIFAFLKKDENIKKYLPHLEDVQPKNIFKQIHVESFSIDVIEKELPNHKTVILFDYTQRDKVTNLFTYHKILI
ncbi:MAG TPA: B12-binding domain-containing radical SAM protein [Pseudobacteroides sp.]|uniref:B12-binding domain-containing radical SAM protein n=1 Tax=Pseudobacteroides sp. TaxID=1968840 RepID=UPI002F94E7A2